MQDMEYIKKETSHVVGISRSFGGSGDPSPVTALGVFAGIQAAVEEHLGKSSLQGLRVAVQGVGHVGYHLVGHLTRSGCKVVVADVDQDAVKRCATDHKVESVATDKIYDVDCDIFAPCAMGASINENTIPRLKCSIIAGAANNQLLNEIADAGMLSQRGILYAPDYVINAGGLINVSNELQGYNQERALQQAEGIYDILKSVFVAAKRNNIPTFRAADDLAMQRIESLQRVRRTYTGARPNHPLARSSS
jgi:leucine dehydrogenase